MTPFTSRPLFLGKFMDKKLLTAKDIKDEFGFDRTSLLRWEESGDLGPVTKTPGGQRRYTRDQIEKLVAPGGSNDRRYVTSDSGRPLLMNELGGTNLTRFGGSIQEERLTELQGRRGYIRYREMRMNHPVIAAVFFGLVTGLKEPVVRVKSASDKPADKRAAEFVESCLLDMSWSWEDTLDLVLNPLFEQGFAVPEVVYKKRLGQKPPYYTDQDGKRKQLPRSQYSDGLIGWQKWAPRPAESLADGNEWVLDAHGGVRGINQQMDYDTTATKPLRPLPGFDEKEQIPHVITIPIEKLLHFRTTLHPANNPEGMSLLRPMWVPYYYSTNLQDIEAIGAERDLAGLPVIYLGEGTTLGNDPNSDWSIAKDIVVNLRNDEQAGVVLPHAKLDNNGRGVLLELLSTGGQRSWDVSKIIERYDKRIALTTLAQFIMLGMQQVGSYALSSHQGDLFVLAAQAFLKSVAGVINRHGVTRLIELNPFPGITGMPEVAFSPVGVPKLDELSEFVNRLVEREVLKPDAELERHMRQVAGLPQPVQEVQGESQFDEEVGRDAEKTALLLRRISLAVEPLQNLGALQPGEGAALLSPLVDELRTALGTDSTLPTVSPEQFEEQVEQAKARLRYDLAAGVPIEKAGRSYIARLKKKSAEQIVKELEAAALDLWDKLSAKIQNGTLPVVAIQEWRDDFLIELEAAIAAAWAAGRQTQGEEVDELLEAGFIQQMVSDAAGYLNGLILELATDLNQQVEIEEMLARLSAYRGRMEMYPGEAWAAYNAGKVFGQPPDSLWAWSGPVDDRSCSICVEQMALGPRRLSEITVMPGRDTECRTNCRHEVIRVE